MTRRMMYLVAVFGAALVLTPNVALACVIDNTASLSANGVRAQPTVGTATDPRRWAPFTVTKAFAATAPVRLDEARADLLRSIDSATVAAPYRWTFGDGTGAALGHAVTHRYARPGLYLIGVEGFDGQTRRWFTFDKALLRVVPPGQMLQSNLGYYGLRALDIGLSSLGWVFDAALILLIGAAVWGRRRHAHRAP